MLMLIIIGIIVLAVGKLKLTRSIVLVGKRARLYGLALIITAIPFAVIVGVTIEAVTPEPLLRHPVWSRIINYGSIIAYMVLLALPFRDNAKVERKEPS